MNLFGVISSFLILNIKSKGLDSNNGFPEEKIIRYNIVVEEEKNIFLKSGSCEFMVLSLSFLMLHDLRCRNFFGFLN